MEIKKAGKVQYLEPAKFAAKGVSVQGFTTRHEGVSRSPYKSLNLGLNTLDSPHHVEGNRSILARHFNADLERLVTVIQVHGDDILVIDEPNPDYTHFLKVECDGIITNQPGVMIGICVADCLPVLLLDPVRRVAAALHAGWKGSAAGIAGKGVKALVRMFDSDPRDILAAVGPGIGPCCMKSIPWLSKLSRKTDRIGLRLQRIQGQGNTVLTFRRQTDGSCLERASRTGIWRLRNSACPATRRDSFPIAGTVEKPEGKWVSLC